MSDGEGKGARVLRSPAPFPSKWVGTGSWEHTLLVLTRYIIRPLMPRVAVVIMIPERKQPARETGRVQV